MAAPISANLVKTLREKTNCGFMECKKALTEADGDLAKAVGILRKSGMAKAEKKADRVANQGVILLKVADDHKTAFMVEINCETDFVASDASFKEFAAKVAVAGFQAKAENLEALLALTLKDSGDKVQVAREVLIAKIGENIQIRRLALLTSANGFIGAYDHGGRAGALVEINIADSELAKDLAMHIVGLKPQCVAAKDLPEDVLAKEKEIYLAQVMQTGKPANIAEKIVAGKLDKFISDHTLLGQQFVKDPNVKISDLLKSKKAEVARFVRFGLGEA